MAWFKCFLLAAALIGMIWSYPPVWEFSHLPADGEVTQRMIGSLLLFPASILVWAIYLGATLVPWLAQRMIDLVFGGLGGPLPAPQPEIPAPEDTEPPGKSEPQ